MTLADDPRAGAQSRGPTPGGSRVHITPTYWDRSELTAIELGNFTNALGEASAFTDHHDLPLHFREFSFPVATNSELSEQSVFDKYVYWSPVEHSSAGYYPPDDHWEAAKHYRYPRASFVYTSKKLLPRDWRAFAVPLGKIPSGLSVKIFLKVKDITRPDAASEIFWHPLQMSRSEDWLLVREHEFKSFGQGNERSLDFDNYQFEALGFAVTSDVVHTNERFQLKIGRQIEFRVSPVDLAKPSALIQRELDQFSVPEPERLSLSVDCFFAEQAKAENI